MKKMNNKGFSLVELIVVVLIMAIIAVALAPQVMKWVENSRKSTDCNNYDSVVSAVNVALADETVMKKVGALTDAGLYVKWCNNAGSEYQTGAIWSTSEAAFADAPTAPTSGASATTLTNDINYKLTEILGTKWFSVMKLKRTTDYPSAANNCYRIKITKKGTVERTAEPGQPDSTTPYKDSTTPAAMSAGGSST